MVDVNVVILAGGASSRLFPFNKILSDLSGSGKTLIQQAFNRAATLAPRSAIHVLAVHDLVGPIAQQLRLPKRQFFVDPVRRGTWPALMWAMAHLRQGSDPVLAVLTGDHIIPRLPAFHRAAKQACRLAAKSPAMIMLGVKPKTDAALWTGYGVFRVDGSHVVTFAEKPTLADAQRMVQEDGWQWNSGMFFFRLSTAEQALAQFQPGMRRQYDALCAAVARGKAKEASRLYADFPAKIPHPLDPARQVDNTIDFSIMTPLTLPSPQRGEGLRERGAVPLQALAVCGGLPVWTDLGQWEALSDVLRRDRRNNLRLGRVTLDPQTQGCILAADQGYRLIVKGLRNAVIAVSKRGVLVLPRHELPRIKDHVAQAKGTRSKVVVGIPDVRVTRRKQAIVVQNTRPKTTK